jgi:hypothetical protein
VNLQVRRETYRLEVILCSSIHFKPSIHVENYELFASFISKLPAALHHRLRTIVLEPDGTVEQAHCQLAISSRIAASYTLSGFCLTNPGVTVKWRWTSITQKNCWVVPDAVYTSTIHRHRFDIAIMVANGNHGLKTSF